MKKHVLSLFALALGIGMVNANPVSVSQAKYVGQQFVQANFEASRQSAELRLVYTGETTRGEASYYVFNVGNDGFVIISADDNFRPLIAYSEEGNFDPNNIAPGCSFFLNSIAEGRSKASNVVDPMVSLEWEKVMNNGRLISRNNGRAVPFLCQTKWNQNPAPYNSECPYDAQSPNAGYHAYVGCVATAMSQIMKYWNYPAQGTGSHSYSHPKYGTVSANFGATTYDWDNMLNSYSTGSYTQEQGQAVATLCYHCGVAVDMDYGGDVEEGSGSNLVRVPNAIASYFGYTSQANTIQKSSNLNTWMNLLKESFDMGWPVAYSGSEPGAGYGHAFVCDGYDDNDMFHFNWGWGGSGDGMFTIEGIDYTQGVQGVFNFVPAETYNNTAQAPTNLTVTPAANYELAATVSWKNPTTTLNNTSLTVIDRIVVTRDGEVVYTEDNVQPGANMSITDNSVPRFDAFDYQVYAVVNGAHGKVANKYQVSFGPTCGWTVIISKAALNGFRGAAIHIYNMAGTEFTSLTTTSGTVQTIPVDMPLGKVSFGWSAPTFGNAFDIAFTIKNSQNQTVYSYDGSTSDMPAGIFFDINNDCGNETISGMVTNCVAIVDEENPNNVHVSWDPISGVTGGYGYTIYRDDVLCRLVPNGTSFVDENVPVGGHCYYVGYFSEGGENGLFSNESCASIGACYPPTDIDFEYSGANNRIKLKWNRPEPSTGLTGYYLFRKFGEDGTYQRVKLMGASSTSYTDNSANQEGDYYYKLYAYYSGLDCTSAPANWINDDNQFYIMAHYSVTGVNELTEGSVNVFPNPTTSRFTVEGEGLNHVMVFNTLGQKVFEADCQGDSFDINLNNVETGVYMVRVFTANGEVTKRISVIK